MEFDDINEANRVFDKTAELLLETVYHLIYTVGKCQGTAEAMEDEWSKKIQADSSFKPPAQEDMDYGASVGGGVLLKRALDGLLKKLSSDEDFSYVFRNGMVDPDYLLNRGFREGYDLAVKSGVAATEERKKFINTLVEKTNNVEPNGE